MENQVWYHFKFNLVTEEMGPIKAGRAHESSIEDGIHFEFWVPGNSASLRGKEIYIFGINVGWEHGLTGRLESAFPNARNIQEKIREKLDTEIDDGSEGPEIFRHERGLFLEGLFNKAKSTLIEYSNRSDAAVEERGLHEDYSWSYNFQFFAKVRLP